MATLEARVRQLEAQTPMDKDGMLIIVRALVGANYSTLGPDRVVSYEPIGLRSMRDERRWPRRQGESVEALTARVKAELQAEGHKTYLVCEEYGA